jgi:hypothetical protein
MLGIIRVEEIKFYDYFQGNYLEVCFTSPGRARVFAIKALSLGIDCLVDNGCIYFDTKEEFDLVMNSGR